METIYLITQQCIELDKPSYLQNRERFPMYAVKTYEEAKKELEILRKEEEKRMKEIKNSACAFEYDYQPLQLCE